MATTTFRDAVKLLAPPWFQGFWGYRLLYSMAIQIDAVAEALRQGTLSRMPGYGTEEALPHIGNDRQIQQGVNEPNAAFIIRLRAAFDTWKIAGSAQAVLLEILASMSPDAPKLRYVVEGKDENGANINDWVTIDGGVVSFYRSSPRNWDWDGNPPNWRFWIIVYPGYFSGKKWGDGHKWGDGTAWGAGTAGQLTTIRSLVSKWKCAGSECVFVIVASDNSMFDPTSPPGAPMPSGNWDNPANRDPAAVYIPGVI